MTERRLTLVLDDHMRLDQNIEYGSYLIMITKFSVALVFVLCGIETDATDFISRQEFDEFKTNVFNHIQKLTLENDRQSVQIEHQRKTILDLMNSLAKYDEASTIFSPEDSTNISNDTVPLKHSRSFRNDSLISKPPAKETVKSMYFYSYMMKILLDYKINFDLYFTYNSCKSLHRIVCNLFFHIRLSVTVI